MSTDKVDQVNEASDLDEQIFRDLLYSGDNSDKNFIEFLGTFRDCPPPLLKSALDEIAEFPAQMPDFGDLEELTTPRKKTAEDYENARSRLKMRLDDVNGYPDKFSSSVIREQKKKVKEAGGQAEKLRLEALPPLGSGDYSLAVTELGKLDKALTTAKTTIQNHDKEVRAYYKTLKANRSRIDAADGIAADPLWNAERTTFRTEKNAIVDAVAKDSGGGPARDYKTANQLLTAMLKSKDGALDKFIAKWQEGIQTKVDGAKKSGKASMNLVNGMDEGLIASLTPEQQLDLLATLRTKFASCNACGEGMTAAEIKVSAVCKSCNGTNLTMPKKCEECGEPWNGSPCVAKHRYKCAANHFQWSSKMPVKCTTKDCNNTSFTVVENCNSTTWALDDNIRSSSNKELFKARARIMANMQLDPQFAERDRKKRKELVDKIRQDPEIQKVYKEAEEKWGEWTKQPMTVENERKLKSFFGTLVKTQCEVLGHNWQFGDDVTKTVKYKRTETDVDFTKDTGPVQVMFFHDDRQGLFGQCLSGSFPTFIELNKNCSMFHDFKEYVDTIVHENGHAFQKSLALKLHGKAPYDGDVPGRPGVKWPEVIRADKELYNQARMFDENFQSYVQNSTFSSDDTEKELSNKAYRHEPVEEHSWTTGRTVSAALLIPPEVRSFESKAGLDNRILFIDSIVPGQNIVRLKERHPIYVEEWQGEKFKDLKVTLDLGKSGKHNVKITTVKDEYQLGLDFNFSTLNWTYLTEGEIKNPQVRSYVKIAVSSWTQAQSDAVVNYMNENRLGYCVNGGKLQFVDPAKFNKIGRLVLHAFPTDGARDLKKSV